MKKPISSSRLLPAVAAIVGALLVSMTAMALLSDRPGQGALYLLAGPLMSPLSLGNTLAAAARLTLAGCGASLAFRSGIFNLGGEGQALAGGLAAAGTAMMLPNLTSPVSLVLAAVAGMAVGAILGGISGALKSAWNVDELISTFLISAAVAPIAHVVLSGPMKDEGSYLIAAPPLGNNWTLSSWLPPSRFGAVTLWALAVVVILHLFFRYSRRGYEWKLRGASEDFARYGGVRTGLIAVGASTLSGALYGLAGTAALLDSGQAVQGFTGGLGWDGMAVALIAASRPAWVPVAALAYAWLSQGTSAAALHTGFPYSLGGLVQATVFLLISAEYLFRRRENR